MNSQRDETALELGLSPEITAWRPKQQPDGSAPTSGDHMTFRDDDADFAGE
jgi:hypothetical protein